MLKRFSERLRALPLAMKVLWNEPTNRGQRLRRTIQFFFWLPTQKWLRPRLIMRMDNGLLIRARTTKILVNRYESELTTFVLNHACPGGMMIDVGASVGIFALQVAPRFEHILCVEPSKAEVTLLHQNLNLNWREINRFEVHDLAAGDTDGELNLFIASGRNFVPEIDDGQYDDSQIRDLGLERISVPCKTVDSLVAGRGPVHFLKIDVEGFEPHVLRGARETIASNPRILIQAEGIGDRSELLDNLRSQGLTPFRPDRPDRPVESLDELQGCRDFFAAGPRHPLVVGV